jgi:N utilization substance protein A
MAKNDIIAAIEHLCDEKNISYDSVIDSIEAALAVAYRKEFGHKNMNCKAEFNPEDGTSRVFDVKTVVDDPTEEELAEVAREEAERELRKAEGKPREYKREEETEEEEEKKFNPRTDISLTDAKEVKASAEVGDEMISELPQHDDYGRVAAQTAKQVIIQKLREAERDTLFNLYKDRAGEVINATVQRVEGRMVFMDLGQATAIMPPGQQIRDEQYSIGSRYKVYLKSVEKTKRGPEIVASRTSPEMVTALFDMEVPEIGSGAIEIKAVAREAGSRSKIAVQALQDNIDPIGSCVGQRGARVQTVMQELGGEKIDIIEWTDDDVKFIVNALSPAKVISVELKPGEAEDGENLAIANVADDQLSLAIGKGGQNVRLAAKLAGWKIDIKKDGEDEEEQEETPAEEAVSEETPEAPIEETPAEETAPEEAPAEDVPTEEAAEGDTEEKKDDK